LRLTTDNGRVMQRSGNGVSNVQLKHTWSMLQAHPGNDCIQAGDRVYLHQDFEFWSPLGWRLVDDDHTHQFVVQSAVRGCLDVGDRIDLFSLAVGQSISFGLGLTIG